MSHNFSQARNFRLARNLVGNKKNLKEIYFISLLIYKKCWWDFNCANNNPYLQVQRVGQAPNRYPFLLYFAFFEFFSLQTYISKYLLTEQLFPVNPVEQGWSPVDTVKKKTFINDLIHGLSLSLLCNFCANSIPFLQKFIRASFSQKLFIFQFYYVVWFQALSPSA